MITYLRHHLAMKLIFAGLNLMPHGQTKQAFKQLIQVWKWHAMEILK